MWIALKFFVLLQSKQHNSVVHELRRGCELLSNFLYFCSRNNEKPVLCLLWMVVNCSQIFCTFAVETTNNVGDCGHQRLWIALKFFVLLQSKQRSACFAHSPLSCELLSNFLYFCSRNNVKTGWSCVAVVVNCSQIFCTFAVETTQPTKSWIFYGLWIALKFFVLLQSKQPKSTKGERMGCCELLSNFLYFCSRNNMIRITDCESPN